VNTLVFGQINPDWDCLQANNMLMSSKIDNFDLFALDPDDIHSGQIPQYGTLSKVGSDIQRRIEYPEFQIAVTLPCI
jgi:hypothetical protein